jgi:phage head maturation protease
MQDINKVFMDREGYQLNLGIDFQKATDETERTVVGFATLDNFDQTGDIVLAKASEEAFRAFRGNIREQHNKHNAVGRMIACEPAEYTDPSTGQTYRGVKVAVRISKGAQDTWEKCKDGTYSGFSIGGAIIDQEDVYDSARGRNVKVITKYRLTELSLVDNPANELANFTTVYKSIDSSEDELQKDFSTKNLFWCPVDNWAAKSQDSSYHCGKCGENMARVGVINENENVGEKITKVLSELNITMEGVNTQVANEIEKTADDAVNAPAEEAKTEAVVEEVVVETAEDAPVVEEASEEEAPVEEVETEEAEVTTDDTKINYDAVKALVLDLAAQFNRVEEKLINKYNELETTVTEKLEKAVTEETLTEKLNEVQTLKKELAEAQGTLEKVISATAMSQSEDEDRNETVIEKSNDEETNSGIFEKGLFTSGFNLA